MTPRVYLDRYEINISDEARTRAIEQERKDQLRHEENIRLAREGKGPSPFLVTSIAVMATALATRQRIHEELRVLKFLKGDNDEAVGR